MFWRRNRAPQSQTGLYGKLPQFGDFVRHHAGASEVAWLDEWIQSGLSALDRSNLPSASADYLEAPQVRFLVCTSANAKAQALIGVLRPSRDQSGRRYPMLVFGQIPWSTIADDYAFTPALFAPFCDEVEQVLEKADQAGSLAELSQAVDRLPQGEPDAAAKAGYRQYVGETRSDAFLKQVLSDSPGEAARRAVERLDAMCTGLRGVSQERLSVQVRYPLSPGDPHRTAAFWFELTMKLLHWKAAPPVAFWAPDADRPYLLISLGRPTGRTFLHLFRDDVKDDALCDLVAPGEANPAYKGTVLPLLEEPPLLLEQVLEKAGR